MTRYFFREVIQNIRRSPLMVISGITTVLVLTFIVGSFILAVANLGHITDTLIDEIQVVAFLDKDTDRRSSGLLMRQIKQLPYVEDVHFISKETGLKTTLDRLKGRIELSDLSKNPLPDSIQVDIDRSNKFNDAVTAIEAMKGVAKVKYGEDVAKQILKLSQLIRWTGIVVLSVLLIATILVISSTIRLTVFARRNDIQIMQLVGAEWWFIRWPFIIEGIIQGFIGSLISSVLLALAYQLTAPELIETIPFIPFLHPYEILPGLVATTLGLGLFVGTLGSLIAVNRFLKLGESDQ